MVCMRACALVLAWGGRGVGRAMLLLFTPSQVHTHLLFNIATSAATLALLAFLGASASGFARLPEMSVTLSIDGLGSARCLHD